MLSKELFSERYLDLHNRIVPNIVDSLSEEVLRNIKNDNNSIIWVYWHMVRTEDVGLSRFILNVEQVYKSFSSKVGIKTTLNGTGMNSNEVIAITNSLNFEGLRLYRQSVMDRVISLINSLEQVDLSECLTPERIKKVICEENIMPENIWDSLPLYYNKSKEWFLLHVCLTHPFYHLGQISSLIKLSSY